MGCLVAAFLGSFMAALLLHLLCVVRGDARHLLLAVCNTLCTTLCTVSFCLACILTQTKGAVAGVLWLRVLWPMPAWI